jgi:hypothetical protein
MTTNEDGALVTGQDPGRVLLDKIEAREQALGRQAEQAEMEDLAARLRELDEAIDHLRITRNTLLSLASEPAAAGPAEPPPVLPGHPAYQQILAVFADAAGPMRARDLCQPLDLPIVPKNTENIRSKLKRLVSRGVLVEAEPGLFIQPRPWPGCEPPARPPYATPTTKGTSAREPPSQRS